MAQLKVKQISDFVTGVNARIDALVGTATVTAIGDAKSEAIVSAVSEAEAKDVLRASTAVVNIATAKSESISAAVSADVVVLSSAKAHSDLQKVRIDALLLESTEALDTFVEIERFITTLSTADVSAVAALSTAVYNDSVHSADISANSEAIADLETAVGSVTVDLSLEATDPTSNTIGNTNGTGVILNGATGESAGLMTAEDFTKLSTIQDGADVTDATSVSNAGALMTEDIANLDEVKAFSSSDYATADEGALAASAVQDLGDLLITATADELNQLASKTLGDIVTYNYETVTTDISDAISTEVTNRNTAISTAKSEAIASAKTYTDTEIAALDGRIDGLEGASSDEVVARWVSETTFSVETAFDLTGHVAVFVNGLQVHELFGVGEEAEGWASANGLTFVVTNLGYPLEADDHIIVSGTLAPEVE